MLRNYLKIAWRNLLKSKVYSFINIAGLATGMAVAMLIGLWIWDEVSFDSYHRNHDQLAQVKLNQTSQGEIYTGGTIQMPLGNALRTRFGDDFKHVSLISFNYGHILAVGNKKISADGIWAQREFPEMFTLNIIKGDLNALKDPSTLMLTRSLAKALFGNADPVNKIIRLDNRAEMRVGAVYEDLPYNTTFRAVKFLLPWDSKENGYMNSNKEWNDHNGQLFVQLADKASLEQTSDKIKNVPTPYIKGWHEEIMLHPLDKLHLYDEFKKGRAVGGRIQFVWLFGIVGVFILLLACINFMNLSTARSEKRAKEVGIRKTVGSVRAQLIRQFLTESVMVAFLALIIAIALVQLLLPFFNNLSDKRMAITWANPLFWILSLGFTLFTGLIAGSYPAFYLSGFEPIKVLKGTFRAGRLASLPRKVLVVIQFTVSIVLVIGTIIVFRQIQFAKDRPIGYTRAGLITIPVNTSDLSDHYDAVKNDLLHTGVVDAIATSSQSAINFNNNNSLYWRGKTPDQESIFFHNVNVSPDFGKTVGWTVLQGRDFSREFPSDSNAIILNEAAAKITNIKNPVGETMKFFGKNYTVIGVVKNMVVNSPYNPVDPAVFIGDGYLNVITIRVKPGTTMHKALADMEPIFKKYNPSSPFIYYFNDEGYAKKFDAEERIGRLTTFFATLAIFISCLGLFGLASFVAEQRVKEIGIRKVLGASVFNLWKLLSKEFIALVIISCLIAAPIAWYFLNKWLLNYSYRTPISWWIFASAGIGALLITLITVSYQAIKAALANPVKSLRSE